MNVRLQSVDALAKENLLQRIARSKVDYYKKAVHIAPHVGERIVLFDKLCEGAGR
jgi:hypothetical protein